MLYSNWEIVTDFFISGLGVLANVFGGRTSVGSFLNDFLVKHHNNCGSGSITN